MENVTFETKISPVTGEEVEFAYIELPDGGFTSMTKAFYDEQQAQAEQSTPSLENGTIS
jgi:hypothetical protein